MGKASTTVAPSQTKPPRDATEPAGHDHHRRHLFPHGGLHHHHQQSPPPKQTQPEARPVNRFEHPSDDVNDCADAFIKRFHHQLELQRLQSIENYQKMLARSL